MIHRIFGVSYHPAHVRRILRGIDCSLQKPFRRATQRVEDAIKRWKDEQWTEIKKRQEDRIIVFVDESGFYLLPFVTRTYGPVGNTLIIKEYLSRDHLSAKSGITADGKLSMMVQAFRSPDVVRFIKHLLRHIAGKLLVIWDGSPIHRSRVIKEYLASENEGRIHLERFPAYAPELNPDEGVWNYPSESN